jgi:hypothetical protein
MESRLGLVRPANRRAKELSDTKARRRSDMKQSRAMATAWREMIAGNANGGQIAGLQLVIGKCQELCCRSHPVRWIALML